MQERFDLFQIKFDQVIRALEVKEDALGQDQYGKMLSGEGDSMFQMHEPTNRRRSTTEKVFIKSEAILASSNQSFAEEEKGDIKSLLDTREKRSLP